MKSAIKKLFVILAIVASFVAVPAVWAGPDCTTLVTGTVADILIDENAIVVDAETVYGIPLPWVAIELGDEVVINAHECPDTGKLMACYLEIDGDLIELRPKVTKKPGGKQ